ncbi:MAG: phenylacetate--CoA ligase family protein [Candidatus Eisenbacteria bacterium]|nr:phenylacetate--CoA ligase family protein [Candidatus Eisenbacteria bacterium]
MCGGTWPGRSGTLRPKMTHALFAPLKRPYRRLVGLIPYAWRFGGPTYRRTSAWVAATDREGAAGLQELQDASLRELIGRAVQRVPFYARLFAEHGIVPSGITSARDLSRLPFLDKETVLAHRDDLCATDIPRRSWVHTSTGGTSGRPLVFFAERPVSREREWAFMHAQWRRVGYRPGARIAALRNHALPGDRLFDYNPRTATLVLDPFRLTPANVARYLQAMREARVEFLHTYPSAAATLLRFAREAGVDARLPIRAILASSENVYPGQREAIEGGLGARFFSWYGHSEQLVLAGECEQGSLYHSFPQYGVLELIDEAGRVIDRPGVRGEIVGTGFNNRVMPFIRYRTGDFASYAARPCPCGRAYPLLTEVSGRWQQEMIQRADGGLISMTALNMHSDCFDAVRQFQFVQHEPGRLELHLVPGPGFGDGQAAQLRRELLAKLGHDMDLEFHLVDQIEKTARGKHRFLVQHLSIDLGGER